MNNNILDEEVIDYENQSLGYLQEIIDKAYEDLSIDKRTKQYQINKDFYNKLANIYNKKANDKIFKIIK